MHERRVEDREPVCVMRTGPLPGRRTLVVGLTGGIATGKSTVAGMFRELGAMVIDADEIAHNLMVPGTDVYNRIVGEFGSGILLPDGRIDRLKLGDLVFGSVGKRRTLEAIIHPGVLQELALSVERFRRTGRGVLVLEIPLLIETASRNLADKILVVASEQETQLGRLQNRYGLPRNEALLRVRSQLPLSEKIKYADWVVQAEGTLDITREQVNRVWRSMQKSLAQRK